MAQVRGHVNVCLLFPDSAEEAVPRPAAHSDAPHEPLRVSGHAHPAGNGRHDAEDQLGKFGQGGDLRKVAHPADAFFRKAVGCRGQRNGVLQAERVGEDVGDTPDGAVTVGVGCHQGAAAFDQPVHGISLETRAGYRMHGLEQQGVVRNEQVCPPLQGFVDNLVRGVHRKQDPFHAALGAAGNDAYSIPVLCEGLGPEFLDGQEHVAEPGLRRLLSGFTAACPGRFFGAVPGVWIAWGFHSNSSTAPAPLPGKGTRCSRGGAAAEDCGQGIFAARGGLYIGMKTYVLGGGCFWCLDAIYQKTRGVSSVVSGYTGGFTAHPDYESVCSGITGHAEVVEVTFDEDVVPAEVILDMFFISHDPTTLNRQGYDVGTQYRSSMFYRTEEEREEMEKARDRAQALWSDPIVTEITRLPVFHRAEEYHQDFYAKHPEQGYCQVIINPKLAKARKYYAEWLDN